MMRLQSARLMMKPSFDTVQTAGWVKSRAPARPHSGTPARREPTNCSDHRET
jgi:hypothetical protein